MGPLGFPFILLLLFLPLQNLARQPRIKVDVMEYDFGRIADSQKSSRTFMLENAGEDTLRIERVEGAENCLIAGSFRNRAILPGKGTGLKVVFNPEGLTGRQTRVLRIVSNDYPYPVYRAEMASEVSVKEVVTDISPQKLDITGTVTVVYALK